MIDTKEGARIPWVAATDDADSRDLPDPASPAALEHAVQEARSKVRAEWEAAHPLTPADVTAFYATSRELAGELEAWHATPWRQQMTTYLLDVARQSGATTVVDIGCGAGHDLCALSAALPTLHPMDLCGVEVNDALRAQVAAAGFNTAPLARVAPISTADLLICIDVLEHVPDPDGLATEMATRAPMGCLLFEATASFDLATPLHLRSNAGWHPGHILEHFGWAMVDRSPDSRLRVWRRDALGNQQRASLLLCAYRSITPATMTGVVRLLAAQNGWRLRSKAGDAMISRSRAIVTTAWYRETDDDVFLMIDDDVVFSAEDAEHAIGLCRQGLDIVCGAYPVHNGAHLSCRTLNTAGVIAFGPDADALEIEYAATGFMAVRRDVIARLVETMDLCHAKETWSFYPLFPHLIVPNEGVGGWEYLSEDWGFCSIARAAGFKVWLDPTIILQHASTIGVSVQNMGEVHAAIERA